MCLLSQRFVIGSLFLLMTCDKCVVSCYCNFIKCLHSYFWTGHVILPVQDNLCTNPTLALSLLSTGHIQVAITRAQL